VPIVPCSVELADGPVAVFSLSLVDPEFEDRMLQEKPRLAQDLYNELSAVVSERFGGQLSLSREIRIERGGSIHIWLVLLDLKHVIIDYGALMVGIRELSWLLPERIRRFIDDRYWHDIPRAKPSTQVTLREVTLGPAVVDSRLVEQPKSPSLLMAVALSAAGGASLVVIGVLLGHFL
jgi:hypothetical protein